MRYVASPVGCCSYYILINAEFHAAKQPTEKMFACARARGRSDEWNVSYRDFSKQTLQRSQLVIWSYEILQNKIKNKKFTVRFNAS